MNFVVSLVVGREAYSVVRSSVEQEEKSERISRKMEEGKKETKRSKRRRTRRWKKQRKVDRGLTVVATVKVELTPSCHV